MTYKSILFILSSMLFIIACGGDKINRPDPVLTPEQIQENQAQFDAPTVPSGAVTGGVRHYTCPNGHEGSDTQGACIVCGATLVHNQAFHNQQTPPAGGEPPQNTAGVWHYTCPNGHSGGAGSAVACAECGTTLVHNTAYHDTPSGVDAPSDFQNVPPPTTPATPSTPEPAQNADGVWHYTCPNGHDGGAGSAVACSECGTTLVHNQFYHN